MKNAPLSFCMVICSRRRPALISQALASITALEIPEGVRFSVLVVENDSAPQYAEVLAEFEGKISIQYETEPKPGLTYVRNRALDTAESLGFDWIGGIDDDVVIPKDWLVHMVSAIRTYPDTQVFYGNWIRHNHPDEPKWHPRAHHYNKNPTGKQIKVSSFNNIAVRADVISQSGMGLRFDHRFRFIGGEDTDFTRSYRKAGGIIRAVHGALAEEYNSLERSTMAERLFRVETAEYISAVIRNKHDSKLKALFWSFQTVYRGLVLGISNLVLGLVLILYDKELGLKYISAGRRFFARVRGVFRYYFGSDPELYRDEGA